MKTSLLLTLSFLQLANSFPSLPSAHQNGQKMSSQTSLFVPDLVPEDYTSMSASNSNNIPWKVGPATEVFYTSNTFRPKAEEKEAFVVRPPTLEQQKFLLPPTESVVPKMTGTILKSPQEMAGGKTVDNFGGPITNPAAYYLEGANLDEIKAPRCQMMGCDGPMPNDYDFSLQQEDPANRLRSNKACHQTFVPLNGCLDGRGYPVGMVCTICCDCNADFLGQMKLSRGYIQGYKN